MKVVQINAGVNTGSTGRIVRNISDLLSESGIDNYMVYGRGKVHASATYIKTGNRLDQAFHLLKSRMLDMHGFGSKLTTKTLVKTLDQIKPDVIHLHNLHGYYINIEILFQFIKKSKIPVIWTFHDCWAFTGHCSYFDAVNCFKWEMECNNCPNLRAYPRSWIYDNSRFNYKVKKNLFNNVENLTIATPSQWLADHVKNSFLNSYPVKIIPNGIDLDIFKPTNTEHIIHKYNLTDKKIILGIANVWDKRKGFIDFLELRKKLPDDFIIILVGLSRKQISGLPSGVIGISRTDNIHELAALYSAALVYVNPSYVDNFPTTNIEALACGTPVITYNTGGSPEAINEFSGMVVNKGDVSGLFLAIQSILSKGGNYYLSGCRRRAEEHFDKNDRFGDYLTFYKDLLNYPD